MEYGKSLIDKACEICGSAYRLSQITGFGEGNISKARRGLRDVPLEWVPVLAEIAGVNARDAVAEVLAERLPEGSRARAILGGVQAAGVAAMLLFSIVLGLLLPSTSYAKETIRVNPLYIVECWQAVCRLFFMARRPAL